MKGEEEEEDLTKEEKVRIFVLGRDHEWSLVITSYFHLVSRRLLHTIFCDLEGRKEWLFSFIPDGLDLLRQRNCFIECFITYLLPTYLFSQRPEKVRRDCESERGKAGEKL